MSVISWVIMRSSSTSKMRARAGGVGEEAPVASIVRVLLHHGAKAAPERPGHRIAYLRGMKRPGLPKLSRARRKRAVAEALGRTPCAGAALRYKMAPP